MTGTSPSATMAGTARAASSVLTVTRTSSLPAACSARTCAAVAAASAVSVLVMDWTTIGCALPTKTPPTLTVMVGRRMLTGTKYSARATPASLEDFVVQHDAHVHVRQTHPPSHRGTHIGADSGANAHPEGIGVEDAIPATTTREDAGAQDSEEETLHESLLVDRNRCRHRDGALR